MRTYLSSGKLLQVIQNRLFICLFVGARIFDFSLQLKKTTTTKNKTKPTTTEIPSEYIEKCNISHFEI